MSEQTGLIQTATGDGLDNGSCQVDAWTRTQRGFACTSPPSPAQPTRTLGRVNRRSGRRMHSPAIRLHVLWPCNSACSLGNLASFHWPVSFRAFVASQARGFELRELFLPLASFFPKLYCCLSCVASHIQPKGQVFLLDRALLLLNSQWPLLVQASIFAHSHPPILQSFHSTSQLFQELSHTFYSCPVRVADSLRKN